jgi:hypothetical protein
MSFKRKLSHLVALIEFAAAGTLGLFGDQDAPSQVSAAVGTPAAADMLYKLVVIHQKEGRVLSGYLLGIGENMLLIKRGGADEGIPLSFIRRVIIEKEKQGMGYALAGLGLGAYVRNVIFNRAAGQPGVFLRAGSGGSGWLMDIIFLAAGGALGYFGGPLLESPQTEFDFEGSDLHRLAAWESLRRCVLGIFSPPRVHLNLHGGKVNFRVSNQYDALFRSRGFMSGGYFNPTLSDSYAEPAGSINLVRRIQASVSISPRIAVGLSYINLSEPMIGAINYADPQKYLSAMQTLSAHGYFAVGSFEPLRTWLPARLAWEVGLGAGWVKTEFDMKTMAETHLSFPPYYVDSAENHAISRSDFGALIFTELRFYPNPHVSLGLSADYVALPTAGVPEFPDLGLPAQTIRFGNSSFGLTLGIHS